MVGKINIRVLREATALEKGQERAEPCRDPLVIIMKSVS